MTSTPPNTERRRAGFALCIASAAAFGALPIFGKIAFDHDANVVTLLFVRFSIATMLLWLLVAMVLCQRARRPLVELEPLPGVPA